MILDRQVNEVARTELSSVSARRRAALVTGASLLLMTAPAIFAAAIQGSVLVPGDAAATANNLLANEGQLRLALLSFLLVVILDLVVSWGLYVFFEPVSRTLSLLAGWSRLVYTAVFAAAIMNLGDALRLALAGGAVPAGQLEAQAWLTLTAFDSGWSFALALFGVHLVLIGALVFQARKMPRLLAALLVLAGVGYLVDSVAGILLPNLSFTVGQFTFIGELLLAVWLVAKSASARQWQKYTTESV